MRWLLVSKRCDPSQGGIGTYVQQFCRGAASAGIDVELMTQAGSPPLPSVVIHNVETIDHGPEFESQVSALRTLERIRPYRYGLWSLAVADKLVELGPRWDVIEFVDCQAEGYVSLCSMQVREVLAGCRMIVTAHMPMFIEEELNGYDPHAFGRATYHRWERAALQAADGVACASSTLLERLEVNSPSLHCALPFGVAGLADRTQPSSPPIMFFVGSIQRSKGIIEWAHSLNTVLARRRDAVAMVIGPDTPTSRAGGSQWGDVQSLVRENPGEKIQWLGPLDHDTTTKWIKQASVVVVPSCLESFSYVAAEAIGHGVPVIASDKVGLCEHVRAIPRVPARDIEALAAVQLRLLEDPAAARAQARAMHTELCEACNPSAVITRRKTWAMSLGCRDAVLDGSTDAREEIKQFVTETDRLVRASARAHQELHAAAPTAG